MLIKSSFVNMEKIISELKTIKQLSIVSHQLLRRAFARFEDYHYPTNITDCKKWVLDIDDVKKLLCFIKRDTKDKFSSLY